MRRKFIIAGISLAGLVVSTTGFAADQYTYRAGQAYLKAAATDYRQCEAQCRGDAACRGWNFVRPSPRSRSGICEFNARKAVPVSSPVSMSGEINTGIDALMSHAVPLTGNMAGNTVRVGTPIVPYREIRIRDISGRRIAAPKMAAASLAGQQKRIVKRMPIPAAGSVPRSATYKRTVPAQQDARTPRIYGGEAPLVQERPQGKQQPEQQTLRQDPVRPRQIAQQQISREQMLAAQKRAAEQNQARAQILMQRQATARIPQQNPYAQNPYAPNPYALQMPPQAPRMQAPPQALMMPGAPSLYGSLHDDLTQNMTPVPRPQTAPDQAANPDAPLSTSRAVQTHPVQTHPVQTHPVPAHPVQAEPIGYPAIPGLAGGQ